MNVKSSQLAQVRHSHLNCKAMDDKCHAYHARDDDIEMIKAWQLWPQLEGCLSIATVLYAFANIMQASCQQPLRLLHRLSLGLLAIHTFHFYLGPCWQVCADYSCAVL